MNLENIWINQFDNGPKELRIDLTGDKHISVPFEKGCDKEKIIFKLRMIAMELENNPLFK